MPVSRPDLSSSIWPLPEHLAPRLAPKLREASDVSARPARDVLLANETRGVEVAVPTVGGCPRRCRVVQRSPGALSRSWSRRCWQWPAPLMLSLGRHPGGRLSSQLKRSFRPPDDRCEQVRSCCWGPRAARTEGSPKTAACSDDHLIRRFRFRSFYGPGRSSLSSG